jgi:hypothetical protein
METIKAIFLIVKFLFIIGVLVFMFYKYRETDYKKLATKHYRVVIACLLIVMLELISGNAVGAGLWLSHAGMWMTTYFRYKRLA